MLISDAQMHIWAASTPDRPWPEGLESRAHRTTPFTAGDAIAEMDTAGVARCVLVPPSWDGDRNDLSLEAAAAHPDRFAVMGRLNMADPDAVDLATWLDQPGMLGVRVTGLGEDWFWSKASEYGLPVMVYCPGRSTQLGEIARRYQGARIIVDHLNIAVRSKEIGAAIDEIEPLSDLENVSVKLSALPCSVDDGYPFPSLATHVRRVINAFGAERCMWGSDLTRLPCSYSEWVNAMAEGLGCLSSDEVEWIMGKSLAQILNWPPA